MYKVIEYFEDLQDGCHPYEVGAPFPREGVEVSEERLAELAGSANLQKKPLIAKVEEEPAEPAEPAEPEQEAEPEASKETPKKAATGKAKAAKK